MRLVQGHNRVTPVGIESMTSLDLESDALPLGHQNYIEDLTRLIISSK